MKITAFWDTVPWSLAEVEQRFRNAYRFHRQGDGCHIDGCKKKLLKYR
jgi:hypothetical protein